MKRILIVHHSQSGNTRRMAQAVAQGAALVEGVETLARTAAQATLEDLLSCHGLALGSPEYFGYMAGALKDFFDRTYQAARGRREIFKLPYVAFISAGNDGTGALGHIERIALGYQFRKVQEPVLAVGPLGDEALERCRLLGQTLAAGCEAGLW